MNESLNGVVQVGDRLVNTWSLNRFDVAQVHPDGRVTVVDRHGHRHGPWTVDNGSPRAWFRSHRGELGGERLEPLNTIAREVTADDEVRLAAHWFEASVWHTLIDKTSRQVMIAIAEAGTITCDALMRRLDMSRVDIIDAMKRLDVFPSPYRAHTVDGEDGWTWSPERRKP